MKNIIYKHVKNASSLSEVKYKVLEALIELNELDEMKKIGYVSGIISSEGREYVDRNMKVLAQYTNELRSKNKFPIFSATDVFDDEVFERIDAHNLPYEDWLVFWRDILSAGYVTDIFMTPRWEKSKGAIDEYETAKNLGLNIIILP